MKPRTILQKPFARNLARRDEAGETMGSLTDKYCIVGVGETPHMRPSNRTTLSMACEAVRKAMTNAGLEPRDIDGMTSYQAGDSTTSNHVATSLGIRLNYSLDIFGGGSSTEALIAHAV